MEPKKELTIRIHFGAGQRKPKDAEVFQFFKEHGWKYEELTAMYREDRSVYVKFRSMDFMWKALLRLGPKTTFRYADGATTETMVMDAGGTIEYVRIFGLTPEIGDDEIQQEMEKFGNVKYLCRERYAVESGFPIFNGVRGIYMEVDKDLPGQIKIKGKLARVYYDGLKDKCFVCGAEGHLKVDCPNRSGVGAASLSKQSSNSFAQVVANGSSTSQPIVALGASSANNQEGKGQNGLEKLNKKSDKEKKTVVEEEQGNPILVVALNKPNNGSGASSSTSASGTADDYRRPWPKYR